MMYSIKKANTSLLALAAGGILLLVFLIVSFLLATKPAAAYTTGFDAGRIMDDYVFTDASTMNVNQIQDFLNSKVPNCDPNGSGASEYGGGTRAQWAANASLHSKLGAMYPPFTCLKDYSEGGRSAARIIYDTAQYYRINPQVFIVLLQKEQGLVTDTWPLPYQYRTATGYGCPDTAPCDTQYFGLTNQLSWSGKMFRAIMDASPTWNTPYVLGSNYIRYSPNAACGGSNVTIQNRATQALYNYTPYQPNQAALNAGYGQGDACSAHGNRNFYSYFTDWFGRVTGPAYSWQPVGTEYFSDAAMTSKFSSEPTVQPGGKIYIRVKAYNNGNMPWDPSFVRLGTSNPRDHISPYRDTSWPYATRPASLKDASITPGKTGTFEFSITAPATAGTYREYYNVVAEGVTWLQDPGAYYSFNVVNPVAAPTPSATFLQSGESLDARKSLIGPLNQSSLEVRDDGKLVLNFDYRPFWQTSTSGSAKQLVMQTDGNLVLYSTSNQPLWFTGTGGNPGARLNLQLDGNLVLYSTSNQPLWSSGTIHNPNYTSYVNTILQPGKLLRGQSLETADRRYRMVLQNDGNLVLYSNSGPLWATLTNNSSAAYLAMQVDGNLVLYNADDRPIWQSGTNDRGISALVLQQDGNLVTYQGMQTPTWNTRTGR